MGKNELKIKVLGMSIYDKLSPHFILNEMLVSQTAARKGISNLPNEGQVKRMKFLCNYILEPIRKGLRLKKNPKAYVIITSGFRTEELNKAIGGSKTSQHMKGEAVDFYAYGVKLFDVFKYIICDSGIEFDQCIWEYDSWIHISVSAYNDNRNEILSVEKVDKKSKWTLLTVDKVKAMTSEDDL